MKTIHEEKKCPRCGRIGSVTFDPRTSRYVIKWAPRPARPGLPARPQDTDTLVYASDIADEYFGCGYDP